MSGCIISGKQSPQGGVSSPSNIYWRLLLTLVLLRNQAPSPTLSTFLLQGGVRGWPVSPPCILTAGTLFISKWRPLFPEASELQWCACEQVHQVSWVMTHHPLTRWWWVNCKQHILKMMIKNERHQPRINTEVCCEHVYMVFNSSAHVYSYNTDEQVIKKQRIKKLIPPIPSLTLPNKTLAKPTLRLRGKYWPWHRVCAFTSYDWVKKKRSGTL